MKSSENPLILSIFMYFY